MGVGSEVEVRNVDGAVTALGAAGPHTLVVITADGGYSGQPAVSAGISYSVEIEGLVTDGELGALVRHVDEIAEIPNSLRAGTEVRLENATVRSGGEARRRT
jgi:hypothetical protein